MGNLYMCDLAGSERAAQTQNHGAMPAHFERAIRIPARSALLPTLCDHKRASLEHGRFPPLASVGQRMIEGQHINRSLLALGNCINSLGGPTKAK
jgi:hypothetical protein